MSTQSSCLLAIDAGNTRTKWGVYDATGKLLSQGASLNSELGSLLAAAQLPHASMCRRAMVTNVAGEEVRQKLVAVLSDLKLPAVFVTSSGMACQVRNGYDYPHSLGTDRWCALIAAWQRNREPCLVVNAGTALTVDVLGIDLAAKQGWFKGGTITPGLRLMHASLVQGTAGIGQALGTWQPVPRTTADAIYTGAINAMTGAVVSMLATESLARCVLTGGDAGVLAQALRAASSCQLEIVDDLVLQGLYYLDNEMINKGYGG